MLSPTLMEKRKGIHTEEKRNAQCRLDRKEAVGPDRFPGRKELEEPVGGIEYIPISMKKDQPSQGRHEKLQWQGVSSRAWGENGGAKGGRGGEGK